MTRLGSLAALLLISTAPLAHAQDVDALKAQLGELVDGKAKLTQEIVDSVFSFAEVGFHETETMRYLTEMLEAEGFEIETGIGGMPTAWVATWSNGEQQGKEFLTYSLDPWLKALEETALDSSIYITVDTLKYLKKGGRITPAAAALGTLLRIKPILQIQGSKLDAFAKCRTLKQARGMMLDAVSRDLTERFMLGQEPEKAVISGAYTCGEEEAMQWKAEIESRFPGHDIVMQPLSLSVACHIGAGALAVTISKAIEIHP